MSACGPFSRSFSLVFPVFLPGVLAPFSSSSKSRGGLRIGVCSSSLSSELERMKVRGPRSRLTPHCGALATCWLESSSSPSASSPVRSALLTPSTQDGYPVGYLHRREARCRACPGAFPRELAPLAQRPRERHHSMSLSGRPHTERLDQTWTIRKKASNRLSKEVFGIDVYVSENSFPHKREMSKLISAWKEGRLQQDTKEKADAVSGAHVEPVSRLPEDWEAVMEAFQKNTGGTSPKTRLLSLRVT